VLSTQFITKEVARWLAEGMELPSLGTPDGSFTMTLDGNPLPELTARVFNMVQRDAMWQTALDLRYNRDARLPKSTWFDRRHGDALCPGASTMYHHENFP
jgi:hypothetical protein